MKKMVNELTGVDAVVCVQLVFQTKPFGTVLTLVLLPRFVLLLTGRLRHHGLIC